MRLSDRESQSGNICKRRGDRATDCHCNKVFQKCGIQQLRYTDYFKGLRPDQFPYKSNLENLMKCQEGKLKCKVIVLT